MKQPPTFKLTRMLLGSSLLLLLLPGVLPVEGSKPNDPTSNLLRRRDDPTAGAAEPLLLDHEDTTSSRSLQYYGEQVRVNLSAATEPLDWVETRSTYVLYPEAAKKVLREELQIIDAAVGLDVTTSMTHPEIHYQVWSLLKGIVHRFRKQNQIIHANPHYFISSGLEVNCREKVVDPDTNQEHEIEIVPVPGHCRFHCTNHGRYCVMPPAYSDKDGIDIIEETLRRICFAKIYHSSDLRFWEYMEALKDEGCVTGHTDCSHKALQQIRLTSQHAIDNCMHLAGGTTDDTPNVHLQVEVDHRTDPHQRSHAFTLEELPMISVGGHKFTGDVWSVETIFPFVCQVYQQQTGTLPVACQFCEGCRDVRKCLWKLECDGKPFEVDALTGDAPPPPPPPPPPTTPVEPTEPAEPAATETTTTSPPDDVDGAEVVPHYDENSPAAAGASTEDEEEPEEELEEEEEEETPSSASAAASLDDVVEDSTATTPSSTSSEEEDDEDEEDIDSAPPSSAPTAFDRDAERKKQQEEMDHIYVRWLLAFVAIGVCVLVYLMIREHRRRRRQNITEQFKEGTQARWRSRGGDGDNMMDASNTDYSGGMSWPQQGGSSAAAAAAKNTRISRKNRKNKQSVHDQRMNQDHSSAGGVAGTMRTRFLDGLGLGGFGRNTSLENTPGLGFARQSSLENQRVIMDMYNHRTLQPGGGNNGGPAFTRHLSLEQTGARRRSDGDAGIRPRRGSRSWGEALEQHHSDHERRGDDNSGNRFTAAHTAALMEAAATATPVPAQPLTSVNRSRTVPPSLEARRRLQTPLEPIFSSSDEDNSGSSESNESGGDNLTQVSERSRGSAGGGDQLSYSTNWLTGYQDDRGGGGEMNDASTMFEGLEDVTTL